MKALEGIRVLDLSRVLAGPWCTQILGDLGAEVFKIERPKTGDDSRCWGPPFVKDKAGKDTRDAAYYMSANRNKYSVTCDIAKPAGQNLIKDLVRKCDIFIENFKVGDMTRYGLDYTSLSAINQKLVYCSITGFGQTGPYKDRAGYDYVIQGMGGLMSVTGERDELGGGPQKVGVPVADLFAGMYSTIGILGALRHAEATGQGQHVDISLLDSQLAMLANHGSSYFASNGTIPRRAGNAHVSIVPYQVFEVRPPPSGRPLSATAGGTASPPSAGGGVPPPPPARDFIILAVGNDGQFARFCEAAGRADLQADERYKSNAGRVRHRAELVPELEKLMRTRTKADWLARLEAATVPCGPINNIGEAMQDPQVLARGMVKTWPHAVAGDVTLVSSPLRLSRTPVKKSVITQGYGWQEDMAPPVLGQHTDHVLSQVLGYTDEAITALRAAGTI